MLSSFVLYLFDCCRACVRLPDQELLAMNPVCADCNAPNPDWASVNLGVVVRDFAFSIAVPVDLCVVFACLHACWCMRVCVPNACNAWRLRGFVSATACSLFRPHRPRLRSA